MKPSRWFACLLVLSCAAAIAQTTAEEVRKKFPDFRYLDPGQLRELPEAVRTDMGKLGCRVPKFMKWDARHNVIQGQFFKPGQNDWAVLCQVGVAFDFVPFEAGCREKFEFEIILSHRVSHVWSNET